MLALAGRFDSIILPTISSSTDNSSYLVVSEEQTNNAEHTVQQTYDTENIFTEEYQLDNHNDSTKSDDNSVALMKKGKETKSACITAFSSGTGIAGIVGYGYKALFSDVFGLGLSATIYSAILFAIAYAFIYLKGLHHMETIKTEQVEPVSSESSLLVNNSQTSSNDNPSSALEMVSTEVDHQTNSSQQLDISQRSDSTTTLSHNLTSIERFMLVLSLWPYTIPLFTVYTAEYMLQAGVWPAIGFPVTSSKARAQFYHYSNWTYQAGVFLSRSSGNMWSASLPILWLMPFLQVINLYFFWFDSIHQFWYNYYLLLPCFFAGLLGGGVYVQGYSRVNKDLPMEKREFAIASVGLADSLGIFIADILSLYIQSCIYQQNNLQGAVVDCPL